MMSLICLFGIVNCDATGAGDDPQPEDWVYLQNDHLRVGFLRSHGGAMALLSTRGSDVNFLNHFDHGRLVQQSWYGDPDGSHWADRPWRYNPVQGGDYRGNASQLQTFRATPTTVYAKTIPRHWASGQLLNECVMEQWVRLRGPVVSIRYRFTYRGRAAHRPHHQETPAVFVDPEYSTLVMYSGNRPWTGDDVTRVTPGWPNEYVTLSENWAAYVDKKGNGIGVFVPGVARATVYRFQGGSGSDCSYVAPIQTLALVPGFLFEYRAYFTSGSITEIRNRFLQLRQK